MDSDTRELFEETPGSPLGPYQRLLCGGIAGITSVTFTYPLDIVRTRLSIQSASFETLKKADLLSVIRSTKGFFMAWNKKVLEVLLPRWNTETHMFVLSWGEIMPTLEDVQNLLRLNIFGEVDFNSYMLTSEE